MIERAEKRDIHCPVCGKVLLKAKEGSEVDVHCDRCNSNIITTVKNITVIEINIISSSKEPNEPMSENSIVVSEAITFLNSMQSREEASSYFSTNDLKRVDLEAICKQLDLPFTKKENMKTLQEKIIEGTVGYKLRSQAIQK